MAQQGSEDVEATPAEETTGRRGVLRRRGLIAGAAALVAGMVATKVPEPVAAYSGGGNQGPFTLGSNPWYIAGFPTTNTAATASAPTVLQATPNFANGLGYHGADPVLFEVDATTSGSGNIDGIISRSKGSGIGVRGDSTGDTGVYGTGKNYGVRGDAGSGAGAAGLLGVATSSNAIAFGSVIVAPATIAGYFNGEVHVVGPFYVDSVANKHGVIAHADGTKRVLYSMEAPESWIEDFGTGTLVGGKATVALDHDFASIIHADDYHVFLTAYGNTNGLHVTNRSAAGFTVQEHNGGTNALTFSYRVVAKPNVGKKVERLPKYTPPPKLDIAAIEKTAHAAH